MITKDINDLFMLCRERLYEGEVQNIDSTEPPLDMNTLPEIIIDNSLSAFLYKPLKKYNDAVHVMDEKDIASLGRITQLGMIRELKKNQAIRIISKEAENRGINFVFFKGILVADLYPQYAERTSSDSDILVTDEEKDAAEKLLCDYGYEKDEEHSKEQVQVYTNSKYDHTVELHTRLWEDYEGPRIESLKRMKLSCPETNIRTTACGIEVNTLGYEKHLVFQLFHIIKHFSLNGIGIRYLIDITLFVNKYFNEIDFDVFWKHMDELGYTKFVDAFFRICITELKMNDKVFDNHKASFDYSVEDLKIDLLKVGNINDKEAGWQIMGAMEAYFTGEADAPKSKLSRQLSMMFPSAKAMPKTYEYARKYPILLPFAWIHRDIKYLIRKSTQKDEMYSVTEKIEVGEKRLRLIEELGLTEK
ncbi:nucleotidyltransferase domain-containing protein [Butyrivibrio sp. XPD2002]|uniref:nucleotidyltransferase domain-containing protein n=1 Tax=Butyrivibrio sp. XPD2002 TaxID=1280665 RepID=UPI00040AB313|nr:nucleotidyltransferase family protein [Butyrivibrio sp. XPD2002]